MYKLKNALLHGALLTALLLTPTVGINGGGASSGTNSPANPTTTQPQQGSGISTSGLGLYFGGGSDYGRPYAYRPYYYYYPYQPYNYSYNYPYRPYYYNYNGW